MVNENKTKVVVFSRGKVRKLPEWRFGPNSIATQYEYTYLGVSFNYNGSFEKAMGKQVTQAKRAFFSLVAKFRKLKDRQLLIGRPLRRCRFLCSYNS